MAQSDSTGRAEAGITKSGADFGKNNLDCLRLILASIVVLFHLSALTSLAAFSVFEKYCSPHFAVRSFFVISGLLIYRSYTRSSSMRSYFEKRARRIYPAYFVAIVFVAIALCCLSTLPLSQYFSGGFWKYLGANLLFLNFLAPSLPGVFTSHSLSAVNGALWTLKIEAVFYFFVPFMHFMCRRFGTRKTVGGIFFFSCLWKYGFTFLATIHDAHSGSGIDAPRSIYSQLGVQFPAQLVYFTAGILLLLYFDWLALHFRSILAATVCLFLIDQFFTGDALDVFWIAGMVFVFGFWRHFGEFSKYGDFSYGAYIVHWPILQTMIALGLGSLNPALFFLLAVSLIAVVSILMWHLVESRFLARSSHYRQVSLKTPA